MKNWYSCFGHHSESNVEGLMKCDGRTAAEEMKKYRKTSVWTSSHEGTGNPVFF